MDIRVSSGHADFSFSCQGLQSHINGAHAHCSYICGRFIAAVCASNRVVGDDQGVHCAACNTTAASRFGTGTGALQSYEDAWRQGVKGQP